MPPEQAQSGTPPSGSEILLGSKDNRPYLVARDSALDGDGHLDVVTANYDASTVSVLLGNGGGSFEAKMDFSTGGQPYAVAIGDRQDPGGPGGQARVAVGTDVQGPDASGGVAGHQGDREAGEGQRQADARPGPAGSDDDHGARGDGCAHAGTPLP